MNIRNRLLLLILSVLLPAFVAGAIAVWFVYTEQQQAQQKSLSEAARALAQLVDNELESSENLLLGLSASPDLAEGNIERFYRHAKALSSNDAFTLILSDPQGRQLANTREPWDAPRRMMVPHVIALRQHTDPRRPMVSDLFIAPVGQRKAYAIQVPVVIDGAVRYYLLKGMDAGTMQQFLDRQSIPATWIASVVDRQGAVIARSLHPEQFVGKRATGLLGDKIRAGLVSGVNDGVTLDGTPVRAFFYRSPKSNWTVILSVPMAELNRPAVHASLLLTGLMLLTFVGALALTQRYLRRILVPVQRLRDDALKLGQGQPVVPCDSGLAELDLVNAALVRASSDLREARTGLERRVAEAVESTERAQRALLHSQKLEALGRLTGGVAHDFNNVLQTLTSALQLISLEANPLRIPERVAVCRKAVARATALVAQLRAFGRQQDAYLQRIRADEAVAAVLPMLRNGLPGTIALETDIAPGAWPVEVDLTQFELALLNLVINARDAIDGPGRILLHVDHHVRQEAAGTLPAGDFVRIRVADTGAGMPPDVLARAFDPFYTTKPVDQGSGLGLPQAYGFATQSGGTLTLDSTPGAGTTATLYLPRAAGAAGQALHDAPQQEGRAAPALRATVLFVEDDALVRDSVKPILQQAGATVLCAAGSEEALRILASGQRIDILFSDIVMPGEMNGVMLARHVRERHPHIALVLATGYFGEKFDVPDARLLTKPYQASDVLDALAQALAAMPSATAE